MNNLNNNLTNNLILYNISNYKHIIDNSTNEILNKIIIIIVEYMRLITETIVIKNNYHYHFVIKRGVETIIHVFSIIFSFTKNLELTFYHTQKAYYFYIEYIEQISNDNITFLQLSSRDATLFVYKKTIFELNNEYIKNIHKQTPEEHIILSNIDTYIHTYKAIISFIINNINFKYEHINTICNKIEYIYNELNKIQYKRINYIYSFIILFNDIKLPITDFFKILTQFIQKINNKKKFDEKILKHKIYNLDLNTFINNNEIDKIIQWISTI
jgi:hypothetical protein